MALLPIVEIPDPRLRLMSGPVTAVTDETRALVADMFETMYAAHGIGLAAIQTGVAQRVLVIDLQERVDGGEGAEPRVVRDPHAYINPEILAVSEEVSVYSEGCLSIPEQYADVTRPARCTVRWLDERGARHEQEVSGLLATCLQHEIDHLNGVLFIDHISRLKRQMIVKKVDKMRRAG